MEVSARLKISRATLLGSIAALLALLSVAGPARADTIAYSCGYDICVIDPDNPGTSTNLTETDPAAAQERSPAWAPGGNWIAYVANSPGNAYDVWVLDPAKSAAEGETTNVSDNDEANGDFETPPVWSPDGTRVAYTENWNSSLQTGYDVFVSPFDGTTDQVPIGQTKRRRDLPELDA